MEMDSVQAGAQPAKREFHAAMDRRFERKEEWKNRLGNRYTAAEILAPARCSEWKLAEPEEKYIWPCP
jgi:hypothetical protein